MKHGVNGGQGVIFCTHCSHSMSSSVACAAPHADDGIVPKLLNAGDAGMVSNGLQLTYCSDNAPVAAVRTSRYQRIGCA